MNTESLLTPPMDDETVPEELQPGYHRKWTELPMLCKEELERLQMMTSLSIDEFYIPLSHQEHHYHVSLFFSKARMYVTHYINEMKLIHQKLKYKTVERRIFHGMSKLCHVVLLANDWTGALEIYQDALAYDAQLFSRDPTMYFGLGLVYLHFKQWDMAIEAFSRQLYAFPCGRTALEAKVRLGMCYMQKEDYARCLNLFNLALSDVDESKFMSKFIIRYNIARSHENYEELETAETEYNALIDDLKNWIRDNSSDPMSDFLIRVKGACQRQIGWIFYRRTYKDEANKQALLKKAEEMLHAAQKDDPYDGQSFYCMGRVYGDTETNVTGEKAHEAFVNYRQSIDKAEQNADTWCSIGALYQRQNQPMDALQAFVCAVELNPAHSAAWTDLGELYEKNCQYQDALECFKNAMKHSPVAPDPIKARVQFLEKELSMPIPVRPPNHPTPHVFEREIPSLKDAYHQPIPKELRTRQDDVYEARELRYDNALWDLWVEMKPVEEEHHRMDDDDWDTPAPRMMQELEIQVMNQLRANQSLLVKAEREVLECLEVNEACMQERIIDSIVPASDMEMPRVTKEMIDRLQETGHLLENPRQYSYPFLEKIAYTDFPESFSLLSELYVSLDVSAQEILDLAAKRVISNGLYTPIFEDCARLPEAPKDPKRIATEEEVKTALENNERHPLIMKTSILQVDTRKEAHCVELQRYLDASTISCIRGLTSCLRLDLSLFSTKSVVDIAGNQELEIRTQYLLPPETNCDHASQPTWKCISDLSYTTLHQYSHYQSESFKHTLKGEAEKMRKTHSNSNRGPSPKRQKYYKRASSPPKILKTIKFGTNVDLSDESKWKAQINELSKLPAFCRLIAGSNMLSHLGHQVNGANTIRLDMKVPGSRIPAHQESNFMAAVNINIGPGDCEWFAVPYEYWGKLEKICGNRGIDYLKGLFWPIMDDLLDAGVPVHRFTQKAGDMVYVSGGSIHWCQATGWCNTISWNVAPLNAIQMNMSLLSYEYNKLRRFKSSVPMQLLCWQVAKNVRFTNHTLYNTIKSVLIRSLAFMKMVHDLLLIHKKVIKAHTRSPGEQAHFCMNCEVEVFSILLVKDVGGKFNVFCIYCAKTHGLDDFIVIQQFSFSDLQNIYDELKCGPPPPSGKVPLTA